MTSNELDDDDDEGPFWEPTRPTPYDKRFTELRKLQSKRDAISGTGDLSDDDQRRLVVLAWLIEKAQKRFDIEIERGKDDEWRRRRNIDEWRAGIGQSEYNTSRRTVRIFPNASLSQMSPDEKLQYEKDRRSDANWLKRRRDKGMTEATIVAAYRERLAKRKQERELGLTVLQEAEGGADDDGLRNLPGFGVF